MAITKTYSWDNDTTATALTVSVPQIKYAEDFGVTSDGAAEVVLTNAKSDINLPETIRFASQNVVNVYTNSDIDPVLYAPSKKGKSIVMGLNDAVKVVDTDLKTQVVYPINSHSVFKFPVSANITAADIKGLMLRQAGLLFKAANDETRINEMMRGILNPIQ